MKVFASEFERTAAPLPGANPQQPMRAPQQSVRVPVPGGNPEQPAVQETGAEPAPGEEVQEPGQEPESADLKTMAQSLAQDHFSDEGSRDLSTKMTQLLRMVGPEHSDKFAKHYEKYLSEYFAMKAALESIIVLTTPAEQAAQLAQRQMQMLMQQSQQGAGPNANVRSGPLT